MSNAMQKVAPAPDGGQVIPISDNAALMGAIAQAARDPNVDVDKMERLFAMHQKMEERQAEQMFSDAMKAAQAQMPVVVKDRHNTQTSSDYATLDAINKAIRPIYTSNGFSLTYDTEDSPLEGHVRVVCRVLHSGGHSKAYHYDQPMDSAGIGGKVNKTPTHARGSAITYGRRYLALMIFNLSTGYDDDGNSADATIDADAAKWIAKAEALTEPDKYEPLRAAVLKHYGGIANQVPREVRAALNAAKTAVMPKD